MSNDRESPCPDRVRDQKRFVKIHNIMDGRMTVDHLHTKAISTVPCSSKSCLGSLMNPPCDRGPGQARSVDELLLHAKDFIDQYFTSIKRNDTPSHQQRWTDIQESIENTGTYDLTTLELIYGTKTAWRNAPRCIGRIQWSHLQVFDARQIVTARQMFEALCNHIKYGTNKGNIRSTITIFPQRKEGRGDFRVWNSQLVHYAGYKMEDASIVGDPSSLEFTEICVKLGWEPKYGMFDVLPLVLSAAGSDPEIFDIPPELILEVEMTHPEYPWFADLGLKWYGIPVVSGMLFDCGGLEFTACPFNGWYMNTEIGVRNFCDKARYDMLSTVATKMGLDTRKAASLWKDKALVEVTVAVLHSFQSSGVTITDHHAASSSFMKHIENEQKLRGGCPADWVWIVPPMSGSITDVFHQEMLLYKLKPSYEYQDVPWKSQPLKKDNSNTSTNGELTKTHRFKKVVNTIKLVNKLMGSAMAGRVKCTILYATETGVSENFANILCNIFRHAFDAKAMCMDKYDAMHLEHESLVLVVTSTFGNGDPPENGESLSKILFQLKQEVDDNWINDNTSHSTSVRKSIVWEEKIKLFNRPDDFGSLSVVEDGPFGNVRYSVFGLGSRAYPHFAAFGYYIDNMLSELGAERIHPMGEGDELCGQEESFRKWAEEVFEAACETFCVGDRVDMKEATSSLTDRLWTPTRFRLTPFQDKKDPDLCQALSKIHNRKIIPCIMKERTQLQSPESERQTILVKMDTQGDTALTYQPGDHVGVYPANDSALVDAILSRLSEAMPPDTVVKTEYLHENVTPVGTSESWTQFGKIPVCSLQMAFTYLLDVTTPPSQALLQLLATQATTYKDKERLGVLAKDLKSYEDWRYDHSPNLLEVLDQFPSLRVPPSLLMTQLPLLQQRYYSISSSPQVSPGDIHATIAVVKYRTQKGSGPVHQGVCSSWLNCCDVGTIVPCMIRGTPSFHLPETKSAPIIMVGPGTGIAPFRSFWQQRSLDLQMTTDEKKKEFGRMDMYFGCRYSVQDNIYRVELENMKRLGVLSDYRVALSREPGVPKTYVQDVLLNNASDVCTTLTQLGGHFYVCGDVSMAHDVTQTLENILQKHEKMSGEDASMFVTKLRDTNRYHEDIFGVSVQLSGEHKQRSKDQLNETANN